MTASRFKDEFLKGPDFERMMNSSKHLKAMQSLDQCRPLEYHGNRNFMEPKVVVAALAYVTGEAAPEWCDTCQQALQAGSCLEPVFPECVVVTLGGKSSMLGGKCASYYLGGQACSLAAKPRVPAKEKSMLWCPNSKLDAGKGGVASCVYDGGRLEVHIPPWEDDEWQVMRNTLQDFLNSYSPSSHRESTDTASIQDRVPSDHPSDPVISDDVPDKTSTKWARSSSVKAKVSNARSNLPPVDRPRSTAAMRPGPTRRAQGSLVPARPAEAPLTAAQHAQGLLISAQPAQCRLFLPRRAEVPRAQAQPAQGRSNSRPLFPPISIPPQWSRPPSPFLQFPRAMPSTHLQGHYSMLSPPPPQPPSRYYGLQDNEGAAQIRDMQEQARLSRLQMECMLPSTRVNPQAWTQASSDPSPARPAGLRYTCD